MHKEVDKSQEVPELLRLYKLKQISLEKVFTGLLEAGVSVSLIQHHNGQWACVRNNWSHFIESKQGTELRTWMPSNHWKETPRNAVLYTLEKLAKDKFVYLLQRDSASDKPDFSESE